MASLFSSVILPVRTRYAFSSIGVLRATTMFHERHESTLAASVANHVRYACTSFFDFKNALEVGDVRARRQHYEHHYSSTQRCAN